MIIVQKNKPKTNHYQTLRQSMIQNQLRPIGISNEKLLNAFLRIQRETYVLKDHEHIAYNDQIIPLSKDRFLLPPSTLAKLLNHINLSLIEKALVIGSGLGYSVQLLKYLSISVLGIDQSSFINEAIKRHPKLANSLKAGALVQGNPEGAPYDLILIEGGVESIPISLIKQLREGGYLCALIYKEKNLPFTASIFQKKDKTLKPLFGFDTIGALLPEFSNSNDFYF